MPSWIFQTNPDRYDIDGLLTSDVREVLFSANQSYREMRPGEDVYIWRSAGSQKAVSGIVAKGRIIDHPKLRQDEGPGLQFWKKADQAERKTHRVRVAIDEVAVAKKILKRDWMIKDPILKDLGIITFANATNFKLEGEHLARIEDLWANTGVDWTREESLAGLWTYQLTYGGTVSKKPESPVAETAQLIGRAVGGVYNKVMNFRALDPRDARKGLPASSDTDQQVWDEFYDTAEKVIDDERLEREFAKHWLGTGTPKTGAPDESVSQEPFASEPTLSDHNYRYRPGPSQKPGVHSYEVKQAETYYVYVLALSGNKALKVGVSSNPKSRRNDYNRKILTELTALEWSLEFTHAFDELEDAERVEQAILHRFRGASLPSNGEVLTGVKLLNVQLAIVNQDLK